MLNLFSTSGALSYLWLWMRALKASPSFQLLEKFTTLT